MKTSVIEVHDMLSVLTVDEVETRICGVPGVESATVNYAAGNATVRYDEIRLELADIKVIVHQRGHQPAGAVPVLAHLFNAFNARSETTSQRGALLRRTA